MEGKKMDSDTTAYFKEENPTRNTKPKASQ